jgi:hypothetical protein
MENLDASEEDFNEGNQQAAVIDQGNPSNLSGSSLITFRIEVEKGALAAGPSLGSSYFEWSILLDPIDIDGPEELEHQVEIGGQNAINIEGNVSSDDSDDEEKEENIPDLIDNVEKSGRALDDHAIGSAETPHPSPSINSPNMHLPDLDSGSDTGPLKGYEYSEFKPINENSLIDASVYMYPTQSDALDALTDLQKVLHLPCDTGKGYKDTEFAHR